ncbi:MAG: caspase family protein, partial [Deltaproteobacteria bacterium]|nr:caspase family protein [Deltaproteobacteria bacterium]
HIVSKQGKELYLYKDYYALVVGVSNYGTWPDLPNAVKDAKEVSSALKRLGFKVNEAYNPTSRQLKKALNDL